MTAPHDKPEGWFTPPVIIPILIVLAVLTLVVARNWGAS